jgi:hypothetical protein
MDLVLKEKLKEKRRLAYLQAKERFKNDPDYQTELEESRQKRREACQKNREDIKSRRLKVHDFTDSEAKKTDSWRFVKRASELDQDEDYS